MKKGFVFLFSLILLSACGFGSSSSGELNRGKKGYTKRMGEAAPAGMVYIPSGAFVMGSSDQDILSTSNATPRTITVDAFWMDQTEITNFEYRQFVSYVRDSIVRRRLAEQYPEFIIENEDAEAQEAVAPLNWKTRINYKDEGQREILNSVYFKGEETLGSQKEVDVRQLVYAYSWIDVRQAAKGKFDYEKNKYVGNVVDSKGEVKEIASRSSFIMRDQTSVYPDTLCWIRDFAYSYNEPFATRYFWHPAYDNYPIVGVNWSQARAFCHWRTAVTNLKKGQEGIHYYRLPSELEWEYAARGGLQAQLYPWGGPYTTNKEGCYLANFKPQRGRYSLDGGVRTVPVGSYDPNDYGLYDMAGNVAEWTNNAYDENAYVFYHDMVPDYNYVAVASDPPVKKRKVIRGGSWKDISYFLQCGTRTFEYQDSAKSYIGFRSVRTYMGSR